MATGATTQQAGTTAGTGATRDLGVVTLGQTSGQAGLIAGAGGSIGKMATGTAVVASLGIFSLYLSGLLVPGVALVALLAILGIDLLTGAVTSAAGALENTLRNAVNNILPSASGISGYIADGMILIAAYGLVKLYYSTKTGQVVVVRGDRMRTNPPRRMRRVRGRSRNAKGRFLPI